MSSSPTSGTTAKVEVHMPQMGVSVAEGTIAEWRKRVGDWIEADETLVEISTDKIETEVPSPASGRISAIHVEVGETVDVGVLLAEIDTAAKPGEAHADEEPGPAAAVEHGAYSGGEADVPVEAGVAERPPGVSAEVADSTPSVMDEEPDPTAGNGRKAEAGRSAPVSPVVRRIADEHSVDLTQVTGTGRRGRVTKRDLLAYVKGGGKPEPVLHSESPYREEEVPAAPPQPAVAGPAPAAGAQPLSIMRRKIGEHMVRSLHTAAHCTTIVEADMSGIARVRGRLSYLPFVARATISALREHPSLNATLAGDMLTVHEEINLGMAVSLGDEGLIVPVIKNAQELSEEGLATRVKDLAQRARNKQLTPDEVQGATFTITNPGRYGALLATPIINQPQVAILDLEAVVKRPVVVSDGHGDSIAIRPMTYFCMSWDHRALDGVLAAEFLGSVRRHVEAYGGEH